MNEIVKIAEALKTSMFLFPNMPRAKVSQVIDYCHTVRDIDGLKRNLDRAFKTLNCDYLIEVAKIEPMVRATVVLQSGKYYLNFDVDHQTVSILYCAEAPNINEGGIVYDRIGEVYANSGIGPQDNDATT